MSPVVLKKTRGRPPLHTADEQMARILEATEELLGQHELDAHSMADIARLAGMSKRTLYALVSGKQVLIEKMMSQLSLKASDLLERKITSRDQAIETLEQFLLHWIQAAHTPTMINLFRVVMDDRKAFPDMPKTYFASGNIFLRKRLVKWLKAQVVSKHLALADPVFFADIAADHLVSRPLLGFALDAGFTDGPVKSLDRIAKVMKLFALK